MESLEILANNIANSGTSGFKADRERYSTYWAAESTSALDSGRGGAGVSPVVERSWIDFTQGALSRTGSATHLAITGPGFFSVQRGAEMLYSRNGELQIGPRGNLVNGEGLDVLNVDSKPINIDASQALEIRADGTIWQGGVQTNQLRLTEFSDPQSLQKTGHTYFRWPGPANQIRTASTARVVQGALESANTGPAEAAVRMVNVLRQFESLQKAMQLGNEMNRRLVEEVAKV
ncbi:MAG: flagellar hook basal-body protein [Acidobacteria bacterium]|nr:flagellar hook basal-body protein [Acidobacteriota bacterium]